MKLFSYRKVLCVEVLANIALLNLHLEAKQSVDQLLLISVPPFSPHKRHCLQVLFLHSYPSVGSSRRQRVKLSR